MKTKADTQKAADISVNCKKAQATKKAAGKLTTLKETSSRSPSNSKKIANFDQTQTGESLSDKWLTKPWPPERIRNLMNRWGMIQAEFAVFCNVSYDTVTSWSRGRRKLVRVSHAKHLKNAEAVAKKRKLTDAISNPWSGARRVISTYFSHIRPKPISNNSTGSFKIVAVETTPGSFRSADDYEYLKIGKTKGTSTEIAVRIIVNDLDINLTGSWCKVGDKHLLELSAPVDDPEFLSGRAGCITPCGRSLRISLWSPDTKIPIHCVALKM